MDLFKLYILSACEKEVTMGYIITEVIVILIICGILYYRD